MERGWRLKEAEGNVWWAWGDLAVAVTPTGSLDRLRRFAEAIDEPFEKLVECHEVALGWPPRTRIKGLSWSVHLEALPIQNRAQLLAGPPVDTEGMPLVDRQGKPAKRWTVDLVRQVLGRRPTGISPRDAASPLQQAAKARELLADPDVARRVLSEPDARRNVSEVMAELDRDFDRLRNVQSRSLRGLSGMGLYTEVLGILSSVALQLRSVLGRLQAEPPAEDQKENLLQAAGEVRTWATGLEDWLRAGDIEVELSRLLEGGEDNL